MAAQDKGTEDSVSVWEGRPIRLSRIFLALGVFWIVLAVAEAIFSLPTVAGFYTSWLGQALLIIVIAGLLMAVWTARGVLYQTLTSVSFSIALLTMILIATVFGTVIIQGATYAEFSERYGAAFSAFLAALSLNDIFHSAWFIGFLFCSP